MDLFCMLQGTLLFEPAVDYDMIAKYIERPAFKAHMPKKKTFERGTGGLPIIPDEINNRIESHRLRALELMDQLVGRAPRQSEKKEASIPSA